MKNAKFSDARIMTILRQAENGVSVCELCCEHGVSSASFYKWRAKFGGVDARMMSEMKAMAEENRRLKRMYAVMSVQNDLRNFAGEGLGIEVAFSLPAMPSLRSLNPSSENALLHIEWHGKPATIRVDNGPSCRQWLAEAIG